MPKLKSTSLSKVQRLILVWLEWYPDVRILKSAGSRPYFNFRWASEEARQHLIGVKKDLGGPPVPEPKEGVPLDLPTPRLTKQTFEALCDRNLIMVVDLIPPIRRKTGKYIYWLSPKGKDVAKEILDIKALEIELGHVMGAGYA